MAETKDAYWEMIQAALMAMKLAHRWDDPEVD
jgi:hypothetical protein